MTDLFSLVRTLVDIPSVTGDEAAVGETILDILTNRGFAPERQPVEMGRFNVAVRPDGTPAVTLCTHTDTVPPFIASSETDEAIHGRGSCDAKGILAAMIAAATRLRDEQDIGVGMLFVVGEERDSIGARTAHGLDWHSDYVIVGEPTENHLATGHKGILGFSLHAEGTPAHSAYPELGDSAIDRLLETLAELRDADWGENDVLGPATVNIGRIEGGLAPNVIAPAASAELFVRVVGAARDAQAVLDRVVDSHTRLRYDITHFGDAVRCHTVPGIPTAPVRFGTDIPALDGRFGRPLLLGPGSIHHAHTPNEHVLKADLLTAVDLYARIVGQLLRTPAPEGAA